jgi:hypothetical protein
MFTKAELLDRRATLVRQIVPLDKVIYRTLRVPEHGEAQIIRAAATLVSGDPVLIWVSVVAAFSGTRKYLVRGFERDLCRPIARKQFDELVAQHLHGLHKPTSLPLRSRDGFVGAMQMVDGWNDVSVVAAWSDEMIAFFWQTSA